MAGSFTTFSPTLGTAPVPGISTSNPWVKTAPQVEGADGGIDFELQASVEYPFLVSADRPHAIVSSISEGRP